MPETTVDVEALYAALDSKRKAHETSWREIARELELSPSTFSRMAQGRRPDVDTFATLLRWLQMPAESFMRSTREERSAAPEEPVAMVSSYLRSARNQDGASEATIRRLMSADAGFSATTIVVGPRRLIVYNPGHEPGRRASSLAHELAHVILEHEPAPAIGVGGCRHWDGRQEAEADWLGSTLLVPRASALAWMLESEDVDTGASNFGVSVELFRWRINHTGVMREVQKVRRGTRVAR